MRQRMDEGKYFLSPAAISFHDTGEDLPLPLAPARPLALARKENPAYTPGIVDQTKTLKPVTRLCTHSPASQGSRAKMSLLDKPATACGRVLLCVPYLHLHAAAVASCYLPLAHPPPFSLLTRRDCERAEAF